LNPVPLVSSAATAYGARPTNYLIADHGQKQKGETKGGKKRSRMFFPSRVTFVDCDHSHPHSTRTANASVMFVTSM
jgi:hypothetical protein